MQLGFAATYSSSPRSITLPLGLGVTEGCTLLHRRNCTVKGALANLNVTAGWVTKVASHGARALNKRESKSTGRGVLTELLKTRIRMTYKLHVGRRYGDVIMIVLLRPSKPGCPVKDFVGP
jgi:hypothetical protein